jgi:hypothetical protein
MKTMGTRSSGPSVRWYRSFYFRIGFSFVVFVVAVLVAQSVIFNVLLTRPPFPGRSPNALAAIVAADLGSAMAQNSSLDLDDYLKREYARLQPVYAVMKEGTVASNRSIPLREDILRSAQSVLGTTDFRRTGTEPIIGGPPFVIAPIQVANELRGVVVLPPVRCPIRLRETSVGWLRYRARSCWLSRQFWRPRLSSRLHAVV